MDKRERFLKFDEEHNSPVMTKEEALKYLQLRKDADVEMLNSFMNEPCVTTNLINNTLTDIKNCEENIKKLKNE